MSDLLAALNDPSLRTKLKKVGGPTASATQTAEGGTAAPAVDPARAAKLEAERLARAKEKELERRHAAIVEVLGYMEAPDGSVEDIVVGLDKATGVARGFVFSLVRRGWVAGMRVLEPPSETTGAVEHTGRTKKLKGPPPCTVWPGREWTNKIELPTVSEIPHQWAGKNPAVVAHMYRFDAELQKHVLDEIQLFPTARFPPPRAPFSEPEPVNDGSLASLKAVDSWNERKQAYQQSDHAQCSLMLSKLQAADATLCSGYASLQSSIAEIRKMSDSVDALFEGMETKDVVRIVESIPSKIRELAKQVEQETGIRVREEGLKLTPAFLRQMVRKRDSRVHVGNVRSPVDPAVGIGLGLGLGMSGHGARPNSGGDALMGMGTPGPITGSMAISGSPVKIRRRLSAKY